MGGNMKFDLQLPIGIAAEGARLRASKVAERPLWVAGSTHAEDETVCIEAHRTLLASAQAAGRPPPMLVLAPRRPERFDDVARWLAASGLKVARLAKDQGASDVLLLDAMGELLQWYAAADVAYVGGSLGSVGGHNLLEPAALGKPVVAGPDCSSSPDAAQLLKDANALTTVETTGQLVSVLELLLGDAALARAAGARAAQVVAANRGAAARALSLILSLILSPQLSRTTGPQGLPTTLSADD
jgi:3-deoxy-D-manno-octulosonic-acid transferase